MADDEILNKKKVETVEKKKSKKSKKSKKEKKKVVIVDEPSQSLSQPSQPNLLIQVQIPKRNPINQILKKAIPSHGTIGIQPSSQILYAKTNFCD